MSDARTTPLRGLFARAKGGYYHDGRFADLNVVVDHYNTTKRLELGGHVRGQATLAPAVTLSLATPLMQRLRNAADLARNRSALPNATYVHARDPKTSAPAGSHLRRNLFVVLLVMAPPSQELEPPANPGRFSTPDDALASCAGMLQQG
jgi:hypothetical protein